MSMTFLAAVLASLTVNTCTVSNLWNDAEVVTNVVYTGGGGGGGVDTNAVKEIVESYTNNLRNVLDMNVYNKAFVYTCDPMSDYLPLMTDNGKVQPTFNNGYWDSNLKNVSTNGVSIDYYDNASGSGSEKRIYFHAWGHTEDDPMISIDIYATMGDSPIANGNVLADTSFVSNIVSGLAKKSDTLEGYGITNGLTEAWRTDLKSLFLGESRGADSLLFNGVLYDGENFLFAYTRPTQSEVTYGDGTNRQTTIVGKQIEIKGPGSTWIGGDLKTTRLLAPTTPESVVFRSRSNKNLVDIIRDTVTNSTSDLVTFTDPSYTLTNEQYTTLVSRIPSEYETVEIPSGTLTSNGDGTYTHSTYGLLAIKQHSEPEIDVDAYSRIDGENLQASVSTLSNSVESTKAIVQTWEGFLDGSNVVFSITNYISGSYNLGQAKFRILEMTNGVYREVYNSRDEIVLHINDFKTNDFATATNSVITSVNAAIAGKADKAWGRYTSTGELAESNTVYITEPYTVFAGGTAYKRIAVGEGSICVLETHGAPTWTQGDEGTFKFQDDGGTNYFGFAKTDSYTIGCDTDGISVNNQIVTLTYNVTMSGVPCIWYKEDLASSTAWEQLNLPDGSAVEGASHTVTWETNPDPNTEVCYINCGDEPKGFFKATIEVQGSAKFMTNMPADFSGGVLCTDGQTIIYPHADGSWSTTK